VRPARAGAVAALAWAALEPLDRRLLGLDYSDVAMLGKIVTRSRAWPLAGLALHAANGATFGVALAAARTRTRTRIPAVAAALAEHTLLFPLALLVDRHHPARGEPGLAPMSTARGFALETLRHVVFGAVLGALLRDAADR
jgi:hypothetical protein